MEGFLEQIRPQYDETTKNKNMLHKKCELRFVIGHHPLVRFGLTSASVSTSVSDHIVSGLRKNWPIINDPWKNYDKG